MTERKIFKKAKKYILVLAIVGTIMSLAACTNEELVARVGNEKITKEELYNELVAQGGTQVLDGLIANKVRIAEVKDKDLKITNEEIEIEFEKLKGYYGGEQGFKDALVYFGYTEEALKDNIKTNLELEKLLDPYIEITDEEINEYFETNKDSLNHAEEVRASHILVETEKEANEIKAKIDQGEDFAELAKEFSKDGSSTVGGDLGFFGRGKMVAEFDAVAFSLDINEVSEPVKSQFGYHIIKLTEKKEAKEATLEDSKEDIKETLFKEKMEVAYNEWYKEMLAKYKIENYINLGQK